MNTIIRKNKLSFWIISICLLIITMISSLVIIYDSLYIDNLVYEFLINNFRCDFIDSLMINITKLGDTNYVLLISSILFFIFLFSIKDKFISFMFIFSISLIAGINQSLKFMVKRERPNILRLIEIGGYSFPSGHAMVSTVLYGLIAYISYKLITRKWLRNCLVTSNILVILLIGISRIYLGVHYFTDVLCGFLISVIFVVIIINIVEKKCFSHI